MITKQKMHGVQCDNCKDDFLSFEGMIAMNDETDMREDAVESGWHNEGDKDYCDLCYDFDDNDELIINYGRTK